MTKTYILKVDRQLYGGVTIQAGLIVKQCIQHDYGLCRDDETSTGKPHLFVEPVSDAFKHLAPFTVPTEDLIPL